MYLQYISLSPLLSSVSLLLSLTVCLEYRYNRRTVFLILDDNIIVEMDTLNSKHVYPQVMRTCKEMGIKSVAIYSDADAQAVSITS
jgi:hypothetical protein